MLHSIPIAAVILLNLIVVYYVWRERKRTRSGLFLVINAAALILWACAIKYQQITGDIATYLQLTSLSSTLIPINLLYFAATRPIPLSSSWKRADKLAILLIAPLILPWTLDFELASLLAERRIFVYSSWGDLWQSEGGLILTLNGIFLFAAISSLAVRYNTADPGPEQNLPRHLLLSAAGPLLFTALFSVLSSSSQVTLIPSPALVLALTAQLSILAVIRQEDVLRPLYLSRWIYYSIIILIGFMISIFIYTLYESLSGTVLLTSAIHLTIAITMIIVLVAASLPPVQTVFDRLMFSRAWEYRQLVREAQTELHETRQRLRQAERLSVVGEMAARIAHEIKNPLGPIKGYTQMMKEKIAEMEDFPQRSSFLRKLDIISEEVESIDRRVRHLLDLGRKPAVRMEHENINKIVNRAATLLRLEAETLQGDRTTPEEMIVIREDLDPALPEVVCSRSLIEEALFNICRNSFEAVSPRGCVTLKTRSRASSTDESGVEVIVEDDGPGISEDALRHLYEPFFSEKAGGTGLGLSIVKGHIEAHSGTLRFEKAKPHGTRVALWLPVKPTPDQSDLIATESAPVEHIP